MGKVIRIPILMEEELPPLQMQKKKAIPLKAGMQMQSSQHR